MPSKDVYCRQCTKCDFPTVTGTALGGGEVRWIGSKLSHPPYPIIIISFSIFCLLSGYN